VFSAPSPSPQGEGMKGEVKLTKLSVPAHKLSDNEQLKKELSIKLLINSILIVFLAFGTSLVIRETKQYNRTHG
jgi:hypothetical protein